MRTYLLELTFKYPTGRHALVHLAIRIIWRHVYNRASSARELRWCRMREIEYMRTVDAGVGRRASLGPKRRDAGRRTPSDRRSVSGQVANNDTRRSIPSKRQNPLTLISF